MILHGDALEMLRTLPCESVQCCVTSPPYWGLRDYGVEGQIGLERTPEEYVVRMVGVFGEVRRVLRDDGTLWLNLGDSYADNGTNRNGLGSSVIGSGPLGSCKQREIAGQSKMRVPPGLKPKDLVGIPWMVAFALRAEGWYLRQDIIWSKPNPMPESVTDRCTKAHEYIFLLAKQERYFYDSAAINEPGSKNSHGGGRVHPDRYTSRSGRNDGGALSLGIPAGERRNRRSVWIVPTHSYSGAHFATFPPKLIEPCLLAGSREGDTVLDPFLGSGTVGQVAERLGRKWIGIELNPEYVRLAEKRTAQAGLGL